MTIIMKSLSYFAVPNFCTAMHATMQQRCSNWRWLKITPTSVLCLLLHVENRDVKRVTRLANAWHDIVPTSTFRACWDIFLDLPESRWGGGGMKLSSLLHTGKCSLNKNCIFSGHIWILFWIFTHLNLCLADAIHNFKWVKIIQIWQNGGPLFSILLIDVTFYVQHV